MIFVAFIVLVAVALMWAIKHAGFTADPDHPAPYWRSDASDPGD